MRGNILAPLHEPLSRPINYLDENTCEGICRHTTPPDVLGFFDRLTGSLTDSLKNTGKKCDQLVDDDLLLRFDLKWGVDLTVALSIFAVASYSFGACGRLKTDRYLWTVLHVDDIEALDMEDSKNVAGLVLHHAREPFIQMSVEPRAPFNSSKSGCLDDIDTATLLGRIVQTEKPGACRGQWPVACKISRVLHSKTLHAVRPLDYYICDSICSDWIEVFETRTSVSVSAAGGDGFPLPAPVAAAPASPSSPAAADSEASSKPLFLMHAANHSKARRLNPIPIRDGDEGECEYKQIIERKANDLDPSLAAEFQEALKILAGEEDADLPAKDIGSECDVESQSDAAGSSDSSIGDILSDVDVAPRNGKTRKKGDPSTYGVTTYPCGDYGSIAWSYNRHVVAAHCGNPAHNTGRNRCRMARTANKRASGDHGAWLLNAFEVSTKREHMSMHMNKTFARGQRYIGRSFLKTHIPPSTWADTRFERKRKAGEDEEPESHP